MAKTAKKIPSKKATTHRTYRRRVPQTSNKTRTYAPKEAQYPLRPQDAFMEPPRSVTSAPTGENSSFPHEPKLIVWDSAQGRNIEVPLNAQELGKVLLQLQRQANKGSEYADPGKTYGGSSQVDRSADQINARPASSLESVQMEYFSLLKRLDRTVHGLSAVTAKLTGLNIEKTVSNPTLELNPNNRVQTFRDLNGIFDSVVVNLEHTVKYLQEEL